MESTHKRRRPDKFTDLARTTAFSSMLYISAGLLFLALFHYPGHKSNAKANKWTTASCWNLWNAAVLYEHSSGRWGLIRAPCTWSLEQGGVWGEQCVVWMMGGCRPLPITPLPPPITGAQPLFLGKYFTLRLAVLEVLCVRHVLNSSASLQPPGEQEVHDWKTSISSQSERQW